MRGSEKTPKIIENLPSRPMDMLRRSNTTETAVRGSQTADPVLSDGSSGDDRPRRHSTEDRRKKGVPRCISGGPHNSRKTSSQTMGSGGGGNSILHLRGKSPSRRDGGGGGGSGFAKKLSAKHLHLSPHQHGSSKRKNANDILKSTVMAPVNIAAWTGKAVVDAGTKTGQGILHAGAKTGEMVVHAGTKTGEMVVQAGTKTGDLFVQAGTKTGEKLVKAGTVATTAVANTSAIVTNGVVDASSQVGNSVVYGGKAILGGTTNTVVHGGRSMVKGSVKLLGQSSRAINTTYGAVTQPLQRGSMFNLGFKFAPYKPKKSKWEEGIETIDDLLDPDCPAFQHMTQEQRDSLAAVRKLLLKGTTPQGNKAQHVPPELILMQSEHGINMDPSLAPTSDDPSVASFAYSDLQSTVHSNERRASMQRSSTYILEEFAGVKNHRGIDLTMDSVCEDTEMVPSLAPSTHHSSKHPQSRSTSPINTPRTTTTTRPSQQQPQQQPRSMDSPTASLTDISGDEAALTDASEEGNIHHGITANPPSSNLAAQSKLFVPPEFTYMDKAQQVLVYQMLKWDSIKKWDFNIFQLNKITKGNPMIFMGWAILGAPYSQQAMAKELGIEDADDSSKFEGYRFLDDLQIPAQKLYNFIKVIQQDYNADNPYHNAIHGSDVLQTLHTLIQMSAEQEFMKNCSRLHLFAILLSALVHDVSHFGTTNAFHNKLQTELSVVYNDKSVMENWHVAHAFSRMFNMDLTRCYNMAAKDVIFSKFQQSKSTDCNLLCNATPEQFLLIRKLMIDAILHTDMTMHFEMVNAARGMLLDQDDEESDNATDAWRILLFMLHMADISAQGKPGPLFQGWTKRCFEEFFAQGDQEARLGLPISPNCDRSKVLISESQIGFIKFVVEPAFEVLGCYIPFVQETVLPIITENMMYYMSQEPETEVGTEPSAKELLRLSTLLEGSSNECSINMSTTEPPQAFNASQSSQSSFENQTAISPVRGSSVSC